MRIQRLITLRTRNTFLLCQSSDIKICFVLLFCQCLVTLNCLNSCICSKQIRFFQMRIPGIRFFRGGMIAYCQYEEGVGVPALGIRTYHLSFYSFTGEKQECISVPPRPGRWTRSSVFQRHFGVLFFFFFNKGQAFWGTDSGSTTIICMMNKKIKKN